jgi:hypothetical protein
VFVIGVNYYTVHDTSLSIEVVYFAGSTPEEAISRKRELCAGDSCYQDFPNPLVTLAAI